MSCKPTATLPSHLSIGQTVSNSAHWGIVINPDKPKFHENFPTNIYVSPIMNKMGDASNNFKETHYDPHTGSMSGPFAFYIIPGNLNYAPIYDHELNDWTNGITNNESFAVDPVDYTLVYNNQGPFNIMITTIYPIGSPDIPNVGSTDSDGFKTITNVQNGIQIVSIKQKIITEGTININNLSIDPHTGFVTGSIECYGINDVNYGYYCFPLNLYIMNGAGVVNKTINLCLTLNVTNNFGIHQSDLPTGGGGGFTYDLNGNRIYK